MTISPSDAPDLSKPVHGVSGPTPPTTDAPFEDETRTVSATGPLLAALLVAAFVVAAVVVGWRLQPEPDVRQVVLEIPAFPAEPSERERKTESQVTSGGPGGGAVAPSGVSESRRSALTSASDRVVAIRSSNLRTQPGPDADAVASVAPGEEIIRLSPAPVLGYFRVRHRGQDGWVWWLDVKPTGGSNSVNADRDR